MKGAQKIQATLLPRHLVALGACEAVDLGRRVLWTFLGAESGWRPSQAIGRPEPKRDDGTDESVPPLYWQNVNVERAVTFLRQTKTTEAVEVELDESTVALLRCSRELSPKKATKDRVGREADRKRPTR
jgi:hypothetical protein